MRRSLVRRAVMAAALTVVATAGSASADTDTGSSSSGSGTGSSGSSSGSAQIVLPISSTTGLTALGWAVTQVGKPYLWGGVGPNGWDCSGLVQWAFRQAGVDLPRTTWQQATVGMAVPFGSLAPGDVVVLNSDGSHVGIYAGFGQLFNAYGRGVPVGLVPLGQFQIYAIRRF